MIASCRRRFARCPNSVVSSSTDGPYPRHNGSMEMLERIEAHIRGHELISPGGEVTCLVSGGADSTCLWHVLGALGYRVSALHVNHGLRGEESESDASFCAETLGAEIVDGRGGTTEV